MTIKEESNAINVQGRVRCIVREKGKIIDIREKNLVVSVGKRLLGSLIGGLNSAVAVGTVAVGTDNTAPAAGDTLLGTEIYREACTAALVTTTTTDDTCRFSVTLDEGDSSADGALVEAGLFGGDSGSVLDTSDATGTDTGVLLSRVIFAAINKTPSVSVTIEWDIIFQ